MYIEINMRLILHFTTIESHLNVHGAEKFTYFFYHTFDLTSCKYLPGFLCLTVFA
jgi:hypothetical protein